jgi:outer membrane protein TolC
MHSLVLIALLAWVQADAMTLLEVDAEALANNPDIRSLEQQARVAESRLGSAAAVDDPQLRIPGLGHTAFAAVEPEQDSTHVHVHSKRTGPREARTEIPDCGRRRRNSSAVR